jgi:sec-independent protein translocase protein TatA
MGSMSIWHWLIVLVVVVLLFGRGRISDIMGDVAKGIKSFKKGMADENATPPPATEAPRLVNPQPAETVVDVKQDAKG